VCLAKQLSHLSKYHRQLVNRNCSIYELPKNTAVPTFTSTSCTLRVPALVYVWTRAIEKHVDFCLQVLGLVLVLAARTRTRVNVNPPLVLEMQADWHELKKLQHIMRPHTARASKQLYSRCSMQTFQCPISNTSPSPCSPQATIHFSSRWR